jgi:hypothetical protein
MLSQERLRDSSYSINLWIHNIKSIEIIFIYNTEKPMSTKNINKNHKIRLTAENEELYRDQHVKDNYHCKFCPAFFSSSAPLKSHAKTHQSKL